MHLGEPPSGPLEGGRGLATASELQLGVSPHLSGLPLGEDAEHYADTNDYATEP